MQIVHRDIETFELSPSYYEESWINGNKTHVKEELKELFFLYPLIFVKIVFDIDKDIQAQVIKHLSPKPNKY